jgi:arylsulfatase A-like enzyme
LGDNTLLWYCGDNGTPQEAVATVPFRGWKGSVYEGGIRVPGVIEWPARFRQPRATNVPAVTNDILPTLCALAGVPVPARPLDGTSLVPLFTGAAPARPAPLVFWNARSRGGAAARAKPYLDPELQRGTTPLVKLGPDGTPTRNFQNVIQTEVTSEDYAGERAIVEDRFKLVVDGTAAGKTELFDLAADPAEKTDVSASHPAEAARLARALQAAQESILRSRTGADYR